ncbi:MAG: hypothetical protein ACK5WS_00765 [Alphaproteobacteria bacterium]|jgi:hypothetical protein|nr:hypothetical protein [Candidatus Jidaibacter sp.]
MPGYNLSAIEQNTIASINTKKIEALNWQGAHLRPAVLQAVLEECTSVQSFRATGLNLDNFKTLNNIIASLKANKTLKIFELDYINIADAMPDDEDNAYLAFAEAIMLHESLVKIELHFDYSSISDVSKNSIRYAVEKNPNILWWASLPSEIGSILRNRRIEVAELINRWVDYKKNGTALTAETIKKLEKYKIAIKYQLEAAESVQTSEEKYAETFEKELSLLSDTQLKTQLLCNTSLLPIEISMIIAKAKKTQETEMLKNIYQLVLIATSPADFLSIIKSDLSNPSFALQSILSELYKIGNVYLYYDVAFTHYDKLSSNNKASLYKDLYWIPNKTETLSTLMEKIETDIGEEAKSIAMASGFKEAADVILSDIGAKIGNDPKISTEAIIEMIKKEFHENIATSNNLQTTEDKEFCLNLFEKFIIIPIKAMLNDKSYARTSIDYIADKLKDTFKEEVLKEKVKYTNMIKSQRESQKDVGPERTM